MRVPQQQGTRGSLKWIQRLANEHAGEFSRLVDAAAGGRIAGPIEWRSPLKGDEYAEYRDGSFLELLGACDLTAPLKNFWPSRGPQWDALGVTTKGDLVLVEAKAHVAEMISPGTGAAGESLELIRRSLADTAAAFGATPTCDWTQTFYQYTNRLAHLHFLRANGRPAWLVFANFVGDQEMRGPASEAEWRAAIEVLHGALGLKRHPLLKYVLDVFPEVTRLDAAVVTPVAARDG